VSDAPRAQDVLLRRRGGAEEEVLVSALLAPLRFEGEEPLPRDALMKVFVSKPGVEPLLRFDCLAAAGDAAAAGYDIIGFSYHEFPGNGGGRKYEGPDFR
jgi:complement component 1 Q subcomponent-binding protein